MYDELAAALIADYERERRATLLVSAAREIAQIEALERRLARKQEHVRTTLARLVRVQGR